MTETRARKGNFYQVRSGHGRSGQVRAKLEQHYFHPNNVAVYTQTTNTFSTYVHCTLKIMSHSFQLKSYRQQLKKTLIKSVMTNTLIFFRHWSERQKKKKREKKMAWQG